MASRMDRLVRDGSWCDCWKELQKGPWTICEVWIVDMHLDLVMHASAFWSDCRMVRVDGFHVDSGMTREP